ncbi:MAG: LON peptidase substrate-binding domain-containing protein [Verrucomicrobiota bacterium JB022]|nr:LON peptidase substrate-binding domain-containing protein [Verrucomicrobiota bacterium JB022]
MDFDGKLPEEMPVMTLSSQVLFPRAVMPLHIFEPRYREMLRDVLETNRIFAIVQERPEGQGAAEPEPMEQVGTAGLIRASYLQPDGTSNLVLHGITRIKIEGIVREQPYRVARVSPLVSEYAVTLQAARQMQDRTAQIIRAEPALCEEAPEEFLECLSHVDDPATFADLAAANFCPDPFLRQLVLNALEVGKRFDILIDYLGREAKRREVKRLLQGRTREDEIELN